MITENEPLSKFAWIIQERMKGKMSGSTETRVYKDKPSKKYFVASLCPSSPEILKNKILTKVMPNSVGAEFLIRTQDLSSAQFTITTNASVYYKVFPTLSEQRKHTIDTFGGKGTWDIFWTEHSTDNPVLASKMLLVFNKINIPTKPLHFSGAEFQINSLPYTKIFSDTEQWITETQQKCLQDEYRYSRKKNRIDDNKPISITHLENELTYDDLIKTWGDYEIANTWGIEISATIEQYDDQLSKVTVIMRNNQDDKSGYHEDNFIFETKIIVDVEGADVQPYVIDYLRDDFKYDGEIGASGINCEARRNKNRIETEHMPVWEQKKLKSSKTIEPKFSDLANNPVFVLENILVEMEKELGRYDEYKSQLKSKGKLTTAKGERKFDEDLESFKIEIIRFKNGIYVLKKYPDALRAFVLMNKSFANSSRGYSTWRLFQIIFIVMNIPDLVSIEHQEVENKLEQVEVVYYPTGGGKTESYLGLTVFMLFFDRIRGKKTGVTALIKFPLRLLSLQQLQRIADVLAQAEKIRRLEKDISCASYDCFSMGYFVGDRNTPNQLKKRGFNNSPPEDKIREINESPDAANKYRILAQCPFCGNKSVKVKGDDKRIRLLHVCENPSCEFEEIPVYVSDVEIYRYLPSFIVTTPDKLASVGFQKNFKNILGAVNHLCPLHGYSSMNKCVETDFCNETMVPIQKGTLKDPWPCIQIQDEMHLMREGLGTFDSHYETFIEHLQNKIVEDAIGRKSPVKLITATATINEFWIQTNQLYMRPAAQFPSQGPDPTKSFYSYTDFDETNRLIVGISPHNETLIFSILKIIRAYYEILVDIKRTVPDLPALLGMPDAQLQDMNELLDKYDTILSYHLAKPDGEAIATSIDTQINRPLQESGYKPIKLESLTGEVDFSMLREVLEQLESGAGEKKIDLITATSLISHGVDIDKLNFMVFMGMPRSTAEYIQAMSRVGRKYPGIVFIVFNGTRERDQSYYRYFRKFHEFKDILVEAVPLNRWAKFSIRRTFPGIYCGAVINYFDYVIKDKFEKSISMSKSFDEAINARLFNRDELREFIMMSYRVREDELGYAFIDYINKKTDQYTQMISANLNNEFIPFGVLPKNEQPMTSLRDVDETVEIRPDLETASALKAIKVWRTKQGPLDDINGDDI